MSRTHFSQTRKVSAVRGGRLVQRVTATDGTWQNTTATFPYDDTIPQNTEGAEILTATLTPKSAGNILRITVNYFVSAGSSGNVIAALFQDSTADAIYVFGTTITANSNLANMSFVHEQLAGVNGPTTIKLRIGSQNGIAIYINGNATNRLFGGVTRATLIVDEIEP